MRPPKQLTRADHRLAVHGPAETFLHANKRPLNPKHPVNVWAAATCHPWNIDHDTAWWLTCVTVWPTPAVAIIAKATPTPRIRTLETLDRDRDRLDRETIARLQQIFDDELAALLKRLGVEVMAAIKDPALKARMSAVPLADVWATAATTNATEPKQTTIIAALNADETEQIDKAIERAQVKAERVLEQAATELAAILVAVAGGLAVLPEQTGRLRSALGVLSARFREAASRVLDPSGGSPAEVPATSTGSAGMVLPVVARDVLDAYGGADIGADGRVARDDAGRAMAAGRPSAGGHANSVLTDDDFRRRMVEVGSRIRDGVSAEDAIAAYGREVSSLARAMSARRVVLEEMLVWRRGNPAVPFDPHVGLDGMVYGSDEFDSAATVPFSVERADGSISVSEPWGRRGDDSRVGRWFPGDHWGCQCVWERRSVPVLVPDVGPPARSAEEAIVDEMLGASL